MSTGITLVIHTLNEEQNIKACIESAKNLADEVLVCDMHSEDRTVEFAESMGARVIFVEKIIGHVAPMRFYAISNVTTEWVLALDADERMTEPLSIELRRAVQEDTADVVQFNSLYLYFGDFVRHGGFFHHNTPRFFRKETYLQTYSAGDALVHQDFSSLKKADKKITLPEQFHILHFAYPSIEKYVCKTLGMYARIEGEQYYQQEKKFSFLRLLCDPILTFGKAFIYKAGYKDGTRGFILAVLYAGYRFTTYANLWLAEEREKRAGKETNFF